MRCGICLSSQHLMDQCRETGADEAFARAQEQWSPTPSGTTGQAETPGYTARAPRVAGARASGVPATRTAPTGRLPGPRAEAWE
eukprot:4250157-Heterocapsa_arctica.AAC.1